MCSDEYVEVARDTDLDCDGVLELNEQVEPVVVRHTLDASRQEVLRVDDLTDEVGGRLVDVDAVSAAGATAVVEDGAVVYRPAVDFVGVDRLRARVSQGWWDLELVLTVSVSRSDDEQRTAVRDGGGNDLIDGSVLAGRPGAPAPEVAAAPAAVLAVGGAPLPSRPYVLLVLVLLVVLWAGMSWTVRG